jgi:drug/metabolite transporter (DMT)-like permease
MSHWFIFALIGPVLYALTNLIDKRLLSRYFQEGGVGTLILFSALLSVLALPVFWIIDPTVLEVSTDNVTILLLAAILDVGLLWCYLLALKQDAPSVVITYYQLVPVFALIFGFVILDEVVSANKLLAAGVILIGTSIVSFEVDTENKFTFRWKTAILMLLACSFWALGEVLFKSAALEANVWRSLFWKHVALVAVGMVIFALVPSYRQHFWHAVRSNSGAILSLNVLNEMLYMAASASVAYAVMLAPVALVLLATTYQAFIVLGIGVLAWKFLPNLSMEMVHGRHLLQKTIAIIVTGIGTYMLLVAG